VTIETPREHAKGENGEYDVQNGVFKLKGDVILTQEGSVLKGHELVHVQQTEQSLLRGDAGSKTRVKAHLEPKQHKEGKR
jgi:lipopolysaccharide export system protein LptA